VDGETRRREDAQEQGAQLQVRRADGDGKTSQTADGWMTLKYECILLSFSYLTVNEKSTLSPFANTVKADAQCSAVLDAPSRCAPG
jgi:hypothetical protein